MLVFFKGNQAKQLAAWLWVGQPGGRQVLKDFVLPEPPQCQLATMTPSIKSQQLLRVYHEVRNHFLVSSELPKVVVCFLSLPLTLPSLLLGKTSSSEDLLLQFVLLSLPLVLVPQLFPICMFIVWKQTRFPALSPDTSFQKVYLSGTWRM